MGRTICAALLVFLGALDAAAAEPRKAALTEPQRRELQAILSEFRKVRQDPEKRLATIDRMANLGPIGLTNLLEVINKELARQLGDYRQNFTKGAAAVAARRTEAVNLQEISRLRGEVLALSKNEGLTKEQIVAVGDPGLERLKELIVVSPQDVLAQYPDLVRRRDALQTLGSQWEKCATLLLEKQSEEAGRAASDQPAAAERAGKVDGAEAPEPAAEKAEDESAEKIELKAPSFADYLAKEEEIAAALAMPMDPLTRSILATNAQIAAKLDPEEARCVLDLNLTRNLLGLPPVKIDLALTAAARDHSADMETHNFFDHESPVPGKKEFTDRAQRFGTTASGENIAMGTLDGAVANEMWWHSPGHHRNMLGSHARVGVGKSGRYWTELFGR